jgi:hypothetical protein
VPDDRRRLGKVQALALRQAFDDVDEDDVSDPRFGDPLRGRGADVAGADDGDLVSGHAGWAPFRCGRRFYGWTCVHARLGPETVGHERPGGEALPTSRATPLRARSRNRMSVSAPSLVLTFLGTVVAVLGLVAAGSTGVIGVGLLAVFAAGLIESQERQVAVR